MPWDLSQYTHILPVGTTVPDIFLPTIRVEDAYSNGVRDVTVTYQLYGGGGAITGTTQVTDNRGIARLGGWRLGTAPGNNVVEARSGALNSVLFTPYTTDQP